MPKNGHKRGFLVILAPHIGLGKSVTPNNANYSLLLSVMTKVSFALQFSMETKESILIRFGEKVRSYRKKKQFSQEELAFRAGLHRTYIGMIERAEKNITLLNIQKIAQALEIPLKHLFDEIED